LLCLLILILCPHIVYGGTNFYCFTNSNFPNLILVASDGLDTYRSIDGKKLKFSEDFILLKSISPISQEKLNSIKVTKKNDRDDNWTSTCLFKPNKTFQDKNHFNHFQIFPLYSSYIDCAGNSVAWFPSSQKFKLKGKPIIELENNNVIFEFGISQEGKDYFKCGHSSID